MAVWLDDKRLVKQLLAGDERAFDRFFDENFSRLYRFALQRVPNDEDAARDQLPKLLKLAPNHVKTLELSFYVYSGDENLEKAREAVERVLPL